MVRIVRQFRRRKYFPGLNSFSEKEHGTKLEPSGLLGPITIHPIIKVRAKVKPIVFFSRQNFLFFLVFQWIFIGKKTKN
jgi:hypothetical protein